MRVQAQVIERPANVRFESEVAIWKLTFVGVPDLGASGFAIEAMCNRTNGKCKAPRSSPARRQPRALARHLVYQMSEYARLFQRPRLRHYP